MIMMEDQIWYWGARASGVYPLPKIKESKIECIPVKVTDKQYANVVEFLHKTTGLKYEYSNFWYHARKIFTGKWFGKSKPNEYYCIEHTAELMNIIKPGFIKETRKINPLEFYKKMKSGTTN